MKVAIVCDWLTGIGGAERVVLELHHLYPDAPIYTSQYDPKKIPWFNDAVIRTTWLQKIPKSLKKFLPILRAWSFSRLNLKEYDVIISASGAEAKGVIKRPDATHISYIHAPTHYYWSRYEQYLLHPGFGIADPFARLGLRLFIAPLRKWDYRAAQRPDFLIANSTHIQSEIKKYYHRNSTVVFPPVDTKRFQPVSLLERRGYVVASRQTPYKKIHIAVQACTELGLSLTVIGDGPEHESLKNIAGPTIMFLGERSDEEVAKVFRESRAFIFPGLDDFGITPVEAMAAGTPVIAYKAGGALDYVIEGKTGIFFTQQSVASLVEAIKKFEKLDFHPKTIAKHAETFSVSQFHKKIKKFIGSKIT